MYIWLIPFLPEIGNKCMYKIILSLGLKFHICCCATKHCQVLFQLDRNLLILGGLHLKSFPHQFKPFFFNVKHHRFNLYSIICAYGMESKPHKLSWTQLKPQLV